MGLVQSVQSFATPAIIVVRSLPSDLSREVRKSLEATEISELLKAQKQAHSDKDRALSNIKAGLINNRRYLEGVTPGLNNSRLFRQIVRNEKVHPLRNAQELREKRLSPEYCDKDCQAIMVQTNEGRIILANIFRYHSAAVVTDGEIKAWDLPGDVDKIKNKKPEILSGQENITGYYSISSVLPKSGSLLVGDLSKVTLKERAEVTVSPIRNFTQQFDRHDMLRSSDDKIREKVLDYLKECKDPVQKFHMGNGAYLGWIHVNRDAPENSPDWITVNYVYNRSKLDTFRKSFLADKSPYIFISRDLASNAGAYAPFVHAVFDVPIKADQPKPIEL